MAFTWVRSFAQDDDEDIPMMTGRGMQDMEMDMDQYMDYQPFHFSFRDVIIVILLLIACYVFGKIWKGCSYLLLLIAALFFYLAH